MLRRFLNLFWNADCLAAAGGSVEDDNESQNHRRTWSLAGPAYFGFFRHSSCTTEHNYDNAAAVDVHCRERRSEPSPTRARGLDLPDYGRHSGRQQLELATRRPGRRSEHARRSFRDCECPGHYTRFVHGHFYSYDVRSILRPDRAGRADRHRKHRPLGQSGVDEFRGTVRSHAGESAGMSRPNHLHHLPARDL